jgi:hypothetical protein
MYGVREAKRQSRSGSSGVVVEALDGRRLLSAAVEPAGFVINGPTEPRMVGFTRRARSGARHSRTI